MRIMTLPCDGIGPEIMAATLDVLEAADKKLGLDLTFEEEASGFREPETARHHPSRRSPRSRPNPIRWHHPRHPIAYGLPTSRRRWP